MLVQGRAKLIEEDHAKRYKLLTRDDNEVDSIFVDNRGVNVNGKTLVICSEGKRKYAGTFSRKFFFKRLITGNAGFYEIGIMVTPMALKYSVLGWNHPGFGGSTVNIIKHTFLFQQPTLNCSPSFLRGNHFQIRIKTQWMLWYNLPSIN